MKRFLPLLLLIGLLCSGSTMIDPYKFTAAAPFDPSQLTSPIWWYEADSGVCSDTFGLVPVTTDGQSVGSWNDLSGAGTLLTSGAQPTWKTNLANGKPGVRFSSGGSTSLSSAQANNQKPFTIGFVVRVTNAANNNTFTDGSGGGSGEVVDINANNFRLVKANVAVVGTSTATRANNTFYVVFVSYDISGNYVWTVDGATDGTGTNNLTFSNTTTVIGKANGGGAILDGDILAMVKWGNVSSTETANMSAWWRTKYATY